MSMSMDIRGLMAKEIILIREETTMIRDTRVSIVMIG